MTNKPEAKMPLKGYRERIKHAASVEEARHLLDCVETTCPAHYIRRCRKVFDQRVAQEPK